jgi:superfamily II DNA or RNA helicase
MSNLELTEALLAKIAGWEAIKQARALLEMDRVLSSFWEAPLLRGVVQEGGASLRAGLIIKSSSDVENMCPCRQSRQYGMICSHSVAVGLHYIRSRTESSSAASSSRSGLASPPPARAISSRPEPAKPRAKALLRSTDSAAGSPLELHFLFPPNFAEAASKGRVMVCIEGVWSDGRNPLNAIPLNITFRLSQQDEAILARLEQFNGGDTPGMAMLSTAQFLELLPLWVDHPRLTLGRSQAITVQAAPLRLEITARLDTNGDIVLKLNSLGNPSRSSKAGASPFTLLPGASPWVIQGTVLQPLGLSEELRGLLQGAIRIPRSRVPQFLNIEWHRLQATGTVTANFSPEDFTLEPAIPRFKLFLAGGLATLQAKLDCYYGEKPLTPGASATPESLWIPAPESPTLYRTRNFEAEQEALSRLLRYGFSLPDAQGQMKLNSQNLILKFFAREYPQLEREWQVTLEERLDRSTKLNLERIEPRFEITPSGEQWFDLSVDYTTTGGERFSTADIQRLILSGQSHARLKNGKFALIDTGAVEELQEVLVDCAPQQHANGYRLGNVQAGFLDATLSRQPGWKLNAPEAWKHRAQCQRGEIQLQPPPLGALETVLRPYQKDGVGWLSFLRKNHFGGVLADEMGLGKTLQVLAHLQTLPPHAPKRPSLVVCPTSLVYNWMAEAARFTPGLKTLALQGPDRHSLFSQVPQSDLVVTSYALLRRDAGLYQGMEFDTVVLDEAQHIKNRDTQNAQAVKSIRTSHRLVLTGTPMENSVLDLWSIFDFLMPGYLGQARDFKERYEQPIVRDKDAAIQARLARRLRPFILRRLKRDVAADLPEKIEQVSYCELAEGQRALYQQVLEASRKEIFSSDNPNGPRKMAVLTALLRLRQICCDPRLLESTLKGAGTEASGKFDMFTELLEQTLDGGHRVLVFSQFTTMLGLLAEHLKTTDTAYCYLDGSTQNRAEVVEKFQKDATIPVFLISLKAGGVGLNLTGADTVIHFDPWWNPAVEAQATDRAHRIGQKKVVTSYKLITRDTVEEKILHLQARKKTLIQGMLGNEESLAESLSWEEIQDLLAG